MGFYSSPITKQTLGITDTGKGVVFHGTNASVPRPIGFASIEWIGSVAPINATASDTWLDTSV